MSCVSTAARASSSGAWIWYGNTVPPSRSGTRRNAPCSWTISSSWRRLGQDLLLGVDCGAGGEIRWRTPNRGNWQMSHGSVMPMRIGGRDTYLVYAALGGVACVAASGDEAGDVLWETTAWNKHIVAPLPRPDRRTAHPADLRARRRQCPWSSWPRTGGPWRQCIRSTRASSPASSRRRCSWADTCSGCSPRTRAHTPRATGLLAS